MAALHDLFAKNVLYEALDPIRRSEMEKPIAPLDEQFIDLYCEPLPGTPSEQAPHLGILRRMTERRCMLEPFSAPPPVDAFDGELRRAPSWPAGFYCGARALHLFLVVLAELPTAPETRLLRLLGSPKTRRAALREINDLPVGDPQRKPLLEILAEVRYLLRHIETQETEETEFMTKLRQEFEQFKAELRREAAQAGVQQGKAEALLAFMRARGISVADAVRATILTCRDQDTLDRWLERAVTVASADELIAAA